MNLYIDFGGTNFRYRFDNKKTTTIKSEDIVLKDFLDDIIKKNPTISFIGISFAGIVNNGKIITSPNTNEENFDVKDYVKTTYNINLEIQNDLNCAALAEHNQIKTDSLAVFYIGTGFGSAFIDDNNLVRGANNQSGEIGHIPFKKTPFICGCGRDDCIELSTSGSSIIRWCEYFNLDKKLQKLNILEKADDYKAKIIVENFYLGLAHAFHTSLNLFDFNTLVLGGSVAKHKNIKKFLENEFTKSSFKREKLNIVLSNLKEGALEGTKYIKQS